MELGSLAPSAMIFDFDGVILESAEIKTQAFIELFRDVPEQLDEGLCLDLGRFENDPVEVENHSGRRERSEFHRQPLPTVESTIAESHQAAISMSR